MKPKQYEVCLVDVIPPCDFCKDGTLGEFDFKTRMGPWAHGCETHFRLYGVSDGKLGVGLAQLWITQDQVTA